MSTKAAAKRLVEEYALMQKEPPPFVWAVPDEKDILTWNYIIRGPPDSSYAGGEYHGVLLFPVDYPFKPPGIKMITPSGRFQPDKKICFSMSDYHPSTWNPAWSVATILTGLLSFMLSDEMTAGGLLSSDNEKRILATKSHAWNISQRRFRDAFPDHSTQSMKELPDVAEKERGVSPITPAVNASRTLKPLPRLSTTSNSPVSALAPRAQGDHLGVKNQAAGKNTQTTLGTWAAGWRNMVWEKWRWGALIAFAVVVSRLSGSS